MCRTRGLKRDYRALSEGPIDSQLLNDVARQTRLRRASAASDTSDEPPRKRGRPAKKAPTVDAKAISPLAASDHWWWHPDDTMMDIPSYISPILPGPASAEEQEGVDSFAYFVDSLSQPGSPGNSITGPQDVPVGSIPNYNVSGEPVGMDSSVEEVAGLLLAVAEQAHLEVARQARPAQRPRKRAEKQGKAKKGRSRRRR